MSDLLELARAEEARESIVLVRAEEVEQQARERADLSRRRLLVLRQFITSYAALPHIEIQEPEPPLVPEQSGALTSRPVATEAAPSADASAAGGEVVDLPAFIPSQAKASEGNGATGPDFEMPADSVSGEVSRVVGDRAPTATSERMDATAGETAPYSPSASVAISARHPELVTRSAEESVTGQEAADPALLASNPDPEPGALPAGANEAATASSGEGVASSAGEAVAPASPGISNKDRVASAHTEHPDWTAPDLSRELGMAKTSVVKAAKQAGIELPKGTAGKYERPITIADWVKALHQEHPEWTKAEVARALGCSKNQVGRAATALGLEFADGLRATHSDSLAQRVEEYHRAHPDASTKEIAEALEALPSTVRTAALARGLSLPKLSHERRSEIQRAARMKQLEAGKGARAYVAAPQPPKPAPAAPVARPLAKPAAEPDEEAGGVDVTPITGRPRRGPSGEQFYLRDPFGNYLHWSCQQLTQDKKQAWTGNRQQGDACRQKFPHARTLSFVVIPKDIAPKVGGF